MPVDTITIKSGDSLTPDQRDKLLEALSMRTAQRSDLSTYELQAEDLNSPTAFVALEGDEGVPAAVMLLRRQDNKLWVELTAVSKTAQGQGLARALTLYMRDWSCKQGISEVELLVGEDNRRAIGLFEAAGFHTHHRFMNYKPPHDDDSL